MHKSNNTSQLNVWHRILIALSIVVVVLTFCLPIFRVFNLLRPFKVPTGGMHPAVAKGDHIMMEGVSYLFRKPQKGDVAIFKTDHIGEPKVGTIYIQRIAGEPGDSLRISGGKLYVNEKHIGLTNCTGEIYYTRISEAQFLRTEGDSARVPSNCYFFLGDNSANSADSRLWGFVPGTNIVGRAGFCYWPPNRMGSIK
jgi:signal peptidase I